jgi:hypothetical protein
MHFLCIGRCKDLKSQLIITGDCPQRSSPLLKYIPSYTFFQTSCNLIFYGIFIIPSVVLGDFFSCHISGQRKEAKERRLILPKIWRQKDTPFRWSGKSFFAKSVQPLWQNAPYPLPCFTFYQTGYDLISNGYPLSLSLFWGLLFFPHRRPKKRSKRMPLDSNCFYSIIVSAFSFCIF